MGFFHSLPVPELWEWFFFIPFPFPNCGNVFFQFPSRSRTSGMELSIPVPELPNVLTAHPWKDRCPAIIYFLEKLVLYWQVCWAVAWKCRMLMFRTFGGDNFIIWLNMTYIVQFEEAVEVPSMKNFNIMKSCLSIQWELGRSGGQELWRW